MVCDESLAFALAAVLLVFVVFYVLSASSSSLSCNAGFSSQSPTDRYSFIDDPSANFSPNWSGNDTSDRTVVMDLTKARVYMANESPVSMTATRKLVNQEYGKNY